MHPEAVYVDGDYVVLYGQRLKLMPATDEHRSFVISTWVMSGKDIYKKMRISTRRVSSPVSPVAVYLDNEPRIAEKLWSNAKCLVEPSSPGSVQAWICGARGVLYHAYVPPSLRRAGLFTIMSGMVCGDGPVQMMRPFPHFPVPDGWSVNPYLVVEGFRK